MPPRPAKGNENDTRRQKLRGIAEATLAAIEKGSYSLNGVAHELQEKIDSSKRNTRYYAPDSLLSAWSTPRSGVPPRSTNTPVSILEISSLQGAHLLRSSTDSAVAPGKIGLLNFASAKKPGGGFLTGAQAQEESIARSSTLYPTLMTSTAQKFYTIHNKDPKHGFYSHAMIYSPSVVIVRDDDGEWCDSPLEVDVITSPAVNAGVVRRSASFFKVTKQKTEENICAAMKERMGRILFLFEKEGVQELVLGSFGTGVFQNDVDVVANIWAELLTVPGARFKNSFTRVVFAIIGKQTFTEFETAFRHHNMITKGCTSA